MAWLTRSAVHGAAFGMIEATIMMLGAMLGLSVLHDKSIVILGLVAAGVADAVANATAFHVAEEAEGGHPPKEVWKAMFTTFIGTVIPVILLLIPVIILPLNQGIIAAMIIGAVIIALIGSYVAKISEKSKLKIILEYLFMGLIAVVVTYIAGRLVKYAGM